MTNKQLKNQNSETIPKGWTVEEFGKSCLKIGSGATPRGGADSYKEHGISLIRSQNVYDFKFAYSGLAFIDQNQADELANVEVFDDDILINITGDSVARVCRVPRNVLPARVNQHVSIIRTNENKLHNNYVYYYLLNPPFKNYLLGLANTGATRNALTKRMLENLLINAPVDLAEQRAIAEVLSSFDDKIELLREQNKTLEATAQTIFKEWFVNFNFPDKNGKPYKDSGGKMIDSELGEIPEGWRVGKIKDLVDILSGFAFSSSDFSQEGKYKLATIKNVQDRHFNPETKDRLSVLPDKMPRYCKLNSGDILLSLTGNVGRICLVNGDNFLLNQRVAKLKEKNPSDYAFTYLLFLQDSIFSLLQSAASGTAQQNLSPIQTKENEIIIAGRKTLDQFGMLANKLIQKINDNSSQTQTLSNLRDTLLPKLMRGDVRVK